MLNYNRLKKDQILFLFNNRCKAHNMRYTEHPSCYEKEKPDCSLVNERVGFLDLECVVPDTLILTQQGLKEISHIHIGERVLTHKNRWQKVTKVFKKEVDEEMQHIGTSKAPTLHITGEHPLYVVDAPINSRGCVSFSERLSFSNPYFLESKKVSTQHLTVNIKPEKSIWKDIKSINVGKKPKSDHHNTSNVSEEIEVSDDFLRLIGLFLGDGYCNENSIELSPSEKDDKFIEIASNEFTRINAKFKISQSNQSKKLKRFNVNNKQLASFFKLFYNDEKEKFLPIKWLNLPEERFMCIIEGLLLSGGSKYKQKVALTNTAKQLMEQIYTRLLYTGSRVRLYKYPSTSKGKIQGRVIKGVKDVYILSFYEEKQRRTFDVLDYRFNKISGIEKSHYKGVVYNLAVEEDESYIANGVTVHNCSNLDANWGIILSYAIKVKDSDKIYQGVINKSDVTKFHADQTDKRILTQLIKDLQNFDRIVAHFGRRFDIPYMRTRALMMGLDFPAFGSIKNDDTWVFAKKKLKLNSNRLDTIEMALFGEAKKTRLMSKYWIGAARGDTDALKYIVDHNVQDVLTLERIWYKLRDYASVTNCSI